MLDNPLVLSHVVDSIVNFLNASDRKNFRAIGTYVDPGEAPAFAPVQCSFLGTVARRAANEVVTAVKVII